MKPGIWNFPPLSRECQRRTFTDPRCPGWEQELPLAPLVGPYRIRAMMLALELKRKYVTGFVREDGEFELDGEGRPRGPMPIRSPIPTRGEDGELKYEEWEVDEDFCNDAARIITMWADGPPPSEVEIKGWETRTDEAWVRMLAFVEKVNREASHSGNAGGPATASGSATSGESQGAEESTPPPSGGETPSSTASSWGSGSSSVSPAASAAP